MGCYRQPILSSHQKLDGMLLAFFIGLTLMSSGGHAELFRWVDEQGKTHYSDQKPEQVTPEVIPLKSSQDLEGVTIPASRPFIRPQGKTSRLLLVLDTDYHLQDEFMPQAPKKVGVYYTGKGCTSRGAIKFPDVFVNHEGFLADGSELSYRIQKTIKSLDYAARKVSKYRLLENMKETEGFSLHSSIIGLKMDSCAPHTYNKEHLKPPQNIPLRKYIKHRVNLQVRWIIKANRDQDIIYETTTLGHFNGWKKSTSTRLAVVNALENAVRELFADQRFVNKILIAKDQVMTSEHSGPEVNGSQDAKQATPWFSQLYSFMHGDASSEIAQSAHNALIGKAFTAEVLTDLSRVKVLMSQYFLERGEWPYSLSDIGLSKSDYENSQVISTLRLHSDGSVLAELSEERFGHSKYIKLTPSLASGDAFTINRWLCSSNLTANLLPPNCEAL